MALKAKKPEAVEKRLKLFLFGDYGVGKTTAAIQFPKSYVFDCERGAENDSYVELMKKSESAILQTNDIDEVRAEITALTIEKHEYRTIVLDPITPLESDFMERTIKKYAKGEDDNRIWRDRDRVFKQIGNSLMRADMNVIVTAHGKVDYGPNMSKLGTTFDGWKRWPFLFDLVIELKRAGKERMGLVKKTRVKNFEDGEEFKWSYEEFQKRYGGIIDKPATPLKLANEAQVVEAKRLVELLKIDEDTIAKWHSKARADDFTEYSEELILKVTEHCKKLIDGNGKKGAA